MSDLLFNIRFGKYHLQVSRSKPYVWILRNSYWDRYKPEKWFEIYRAFGRHRQ